MARLIGLLALLLLACTDTGVINASLHIWADGPWSASSPLHINCFLSMLSERVVQVNWVRKHMTKNQTTIAVFSPGNGISIHPKYKKNLQLHWDSNHNVSISLTGTDVVNATTYCCQFTTFPSGSLEECVEIAFTSSGPRLPRCLSSNGLSGCRPLREDLLATLLVGAGFLSGIFILLCCILKMRHRKAVRFDHNGQPDPEGMNPSIVVQLPVKRSPQNTPFSPLYMMINLEYFTNIFRARDGQVHADHSSTPPVDFVSMENRLYS